MKSLSRVRLFATPWTVAYQAPLSIRFSRQEYWSTGCHFLLQGIFLTQGSNVGLLHCRQTLYRLSHQGSSLGQLIHKDGTFVTINKLILTYYYQLKPVLPLDFCSFSLMSFSCSRTPSRKHVTLLVTSPQAPLSCEFLRLSLFG